MDSQTMKILGIVALVICLVFAVVAAERYNANAKKVQAANQMIRSVGMGNNLPGIGGQMKPAMPAATKYAGVLAVLFGIGGVVLLILGGLTHQPKPSSPTETQE